MRELPRPYPERNGNNSTLENPLNTLSNIQIDKFYIQNIRWNIKKKVDMLMRKIFPITLKEEEKRFKVIIEKKKNYDNFRCPICMLILYKPVKTKCSHLFCKECIEQVLKKFDYCPMCRENIKEFKLEHVRNSFLGNEYTSIKIRCWSCSQITDIKNYETHLQNHLNKTEDAVMSVPYCSTVPPSGNSSTLLSTSTTSGTLIDSALGSILCSGRNIQEDLTTTLLIRTLSPFFNKRINVLNRWKFVKTVMENELNMDIRSLHLLYGKIAKDEAQNGKDARNINVNASVSVNVNTNTNSSRSRSRTVDPRECHFEIMSMDDITFDTFILVQIKWGKKKQTYASERRDNDNICGSNLCAQFGDLKEDEENKNNFHEKREGYYNGQSSNSGKIHILDNFEGYQKRKLKKNKTNRYFYVLCEYNAKGLFFTLIKNIPIFKNMNMAKSVIYRRRKMYEHAQKEEESKDLHPPYDELINFLTELNEKVKRKTYHKYFYNAIHLFYELLNSYSKHQLSNTNLDVKRIHFKNNQLEDVEFMLLLFYLKYEYSLPKHVDYSAMYYCTNFLEKIMNSEKKVDYTIFVTNIYTYNQNNISTLDKKRWIDDQQNKSNLIVNAANYSLRKADVDVHFVLRVKRGKINITEKKQQQECVNEGDMDGKSCKNGKNGEHGQHGANQRTSQMNAESFPCKVNYNYYDSVKDICYIMLSYTHMGFQWEVNESLDFLKTKDIIPNKTMDVFFSIEKLILCFFTLRNKKYNPLFWNSTHLLQYLLQFCMESYMGK
ncbi:hypothetical protein, conserved [Plasmodium gonderi]|uniref:RING-type domain-containing protein n=1 Tax=Plasmodium gonderi TaxID=77519 RepID=A0A1Y1JEY8_PLAGO|nr:hypothetical protein, conserved [Plasmodium gonderi]GAW79777.1 hypothetical protein, conserved [Plasmodium gonderi]